MEQKFYICERCGNIITFLENKGVPVMCCGEKMKELKPGTVEASHEKHIPAISAEENRINVQIGSLLHPMEKEHYIEWIALETNTGLQIRYLKPGMEPKAEFVLADGEEGYAAYAYCNLHGLWKAALES